MMKTGMRILMLGGAALVASAGCSGGGETAKSGGGGALSGRYVGEAPDLGMSMELDLRNDGDGVLTMVTDNERTAFECTYQSGESTIALSCLGSSGITLTRLDGGDLEGNLDGTIVRFEKR